MPKFFAFPLWFLRLQMTLHLHQRTIFQCLLKISYIDTIFSVQNPPSPSILSPVPYSPLLVPISWALLYFLSSLSELRHCFMQMYVALYISTFLKKTETSSPSSHWPPIAPQNFMAPFPFTLWFGVKYSCAGLNMQSWSLCVHVYNIPVMSRKYCLVAGIHCIWLLESFSPLLWWYLRCEGREYQIDVPSGA